MQPTLRCTRYASAKGFPSGTRLKAGADPVFCTVEITPESFPPDKTIIVPAGTGANIVMESSTDLMNWSPAAPGSYTLHQPGKQPILPNQGRPDSLNQPPR